MKSAIVASFLGLACADWDESGFLGWLDEERREVTDEQLVFEGEVPDYVKGTFVQSGPGQFSMGDMKATHLFDGFGKMNRVHFGSGGNVTYTSKFLQTSWFTTSQKAGKFTSAVLMGDTDPSTQKERALLGVLKGHNDNNYIKAHIVAGEEALLSDTTVVKCMKDDWTKEDYTRVPEMLLIGIPGAEVWKDHGVAPNGHICMSGVSAHGFTDPNSGVYTAAMGCISPVGGLEKEYHVVYTIDPSDPSKRTALASIPLPRGRKASIMHSMGHTAANVVLVAHPLHMSVKALMEGKAFTDGALERSNGTLFQVVNRYDGSVRQFEAPSFFSGHVVNTWEEDGDVLIDLTHYEADDHYMFYGQLLFKHIMDKEIRDSWPVATMMRFRLKADGSVEQSLFNEEPITSFELPKVDLRVYGKKHCIWYAFQNHAYRYDESPNVAGPFAITAVSKRNQCTGEIQGLYMSNEYPSEVEFLPNPQGTEEDDGVLLGVVYDGNTNSSFFQVIDAKTMKRVAKAPLPVRIPFPVHASFFPASDSAVVV